MKPKMRMCVRKLVFPVIVLSMIVIPILMSNADTTDIYYYYDEALGQNYQEWEGDCVSSPPDCGSLDDVIKIKYYIGSTGGQDEQVYVYMTSTNSGIWYSRLCDEGYMSNWVYLPTGDDDMTVHFSNHPEFTGDNGDIELTSTTIFYIDT